ncbi:MAG: PAS domain S-box protein, partial [Firmicutes bacterium]|nr:PAS domain S-box protein [Bacillota bacterium]
DREFQIRTKQGIIKDISVTAVIINLENEKYILTTLKDITEKKNQEKLIAEKMYLQEKILEAMPWGIIITNQDYDIEYINPVMDVYFENARGKKCYEVFQGLKSPCENCKLEDINEGKEYKWSFYSKDTNRTYELYHKPFVNYDGSLSKIEFSRDISERVTAENATKKSEYMHRLLLDNTQEAIYIVQDEILKYVNRNCAKITGISEDSLLGMNIYDFIPDNETNLQKNYHQKIITGVIENVIREVPYKLPDGKAGWLQVNTTCVNWEGKPATLNFATDITEKKAAEDELRTKNEELERINEQLRAVLNTIPDLLFELDQKGRFLSSISLSEEELYVEPDFFLGKTIEEIMPPEIAPKMMESLKDAEKTGYSRGLIYSLEIKGQINWYVLSIAKKHSKDPNKHTFLAMTRNITEQKTAEEAVKLAEESYQQLFESAMDAIITLTPPDMQFKSVNPSAVQLFGFKNAEELCSCYPWTVSPEFQSSGQPSREEALFRIEDALEDGFAKFEWDFIRKDGRVFPGSIQLVKMEMGGKTVLSATIRDITERKNAENRLLDINKELKEFAYRVTHELKNPVKIIKGYINLLNEELGQENHFLKKIAENSDRLLQFVDAELQLARTGQTLSEFRQIKPEDIIAFIASTYKSEEKPEIIFETQMHDISGDPEKIRQVFTNLYANSINYRNPENDNVIIRISSELKDNMVIIRFSDNGMGIAPDNLEKVFQPGYTKGSSKGTGFGLAIVRKIIEAHKGRIWAESPGRKLGATFCIELPKNG